MLKSHSSATCPRRPASQLFQIQDFLLPRLLPPATCPLSSLLWLPSTITSEESYWQCHSIATFVLLSHHTTCPPCLSSCLITTHSIVVKHSRWSLAWLLLKELHCNLMILRPHHHHWTPRMKLISPLRMKEVLIHGEKGLSNQCYWWKCGCWWDPSNADWALGSGHSFPL